MEIRGVSSSQDFESQLQQEKIDLDRRLEEIRQKTISKQQKAYLDVKLPQEQWTNKILPLEDFYMNLEMHKLNGQSKERESESIELEQIFDKVKEEEPRRILVEGPPGVGKTTLCWKLLSDWGLKRKYISSRFDMVFFFEMKNYDDDDSIEEMFFKEYQKEGYSEEDIQTFLMKNQGKILVIMDGFDEVSDEWKKKVLPFLRMEKFPLTYLIITSRNGVFRFKKKTKKIRLIGALDKSDETGHRSSYFTKRILLKGINKIEIQNLFRKYFGKESVKLNQRISFSIREIGEICQYPLFLRLTAMMVQEGNIKSFNSKTVLYKEFYNYIVRRNLLRANAPQTDGKLDIFQPPLSHVSKCVFYEALVQFGKYALDRLKNKIFVFEDNVLLNCKDDTLLDLGLLIKTVRIHKRHRHIFYQPIHKSFLEFVAAFSTFQDFSDSSDDEIVSEIEHLADEGLTPTVDNLFYVFLGGFLNERAHLIFKALLPHGSWFNLNNACFANILLEIDDLDSFFPSFKPMLPSFVPSHYSVGEFYSVNGEFFSSPIYLLILTHSLELKLIKVLEWDPSYTMQLKQSAEVRHLQLTFTRNTCEDSVIKGNSLLKCNTLSLRFTKRFKIENWFLVANCVDLIKVGKSGFSFVEGDEKLNSRLLISFYREMTEGRWKEKTVDRVKVEIKKKDDSRSLQFLVDLVKRHRINDGVYVEINECHRNRKVKRMLKTFLQDLFHSVVESPTISEFIVVNMNDSFTPVFEFNRFIKKEHLIWKSLFFAGSLTLLNPNKIEKHLVDEAILLCLDEKNASNFIKSLQGVKCLFCTVECFNSLVINKYRCLREMEEICLVVIDELFPLNRVSQLTNLQVLSLQFVGVKSIQSESKLNFNRLLSSLNLRIFELTVIPDIMSFNYLLECVVKGLKVKEKQRSKSGMKGVDFLLEELVIEFNTDSQLYLCELKKKAGGMKMIQSLLRRKRLRFFCWLDHCGSYAMPRDLPIMLFPFDEGFRIQVEVFGLNPTNSRWSQFLHRWFHLINRYCITYVE